MASEQSGIDRSDLRDWIKKTHLAEAHAKIHEEKVVKPTKTDLY